MGSTFARIWPWLARLAMAAALVVAGVLKARNPPLFALDIEAYRLIPAAGAIPLAYYLPFLEILAGCALFLPPLRRGALLVASALLLIFTAMLALAWARGLVINCGCFGSASAGASSFALSIARNMVLLGLGIALARRADGSA